MQCRACGVRGVRCAWRVHLAPRAMLEERSTPRIGLINFWVHDAQHPPCEKSRRFRTGRPYNHVVDSALCSQAGISAHSWAQMESFGRRGVVHIKAAFCEFVFALTGVQLGWLQRAKVSSLLRARSCRRSASTCTCGRTSTHVSSAYAWQPHRAVRRGRLAWSANLLHQDVFMYTIAA